jgi:hypothetical protein
MFGYLRDKASEVTLSREFFHKTGLCQPSWVTLQSDEAYMHLGLAFLSEEEDNTIGLPPNLELIFSKSE